MKIALASDLHLEFQDIELFNTEGAEVLILSGDIMVVEDLHMHPDIAPTVTSPYASYINLGTRQMSAMRFRGFLERVSKEFPHVVYVMGNHEFYHGKWVQHIQVLRDECKKFNNIHLLEMDTVKINDVVFVGGTLWTDMNKGEPLTLHAVRDMMNDFSIIRNDQFGYRKLSPHDTVIRHVATKQYIDLVLSDNKDKKCVVVGHHAPTYLSIHDDYKNAQLMNGAYASDLSEFILDRPQIKLWTHGHTHNVFDYMVGDTRVVCNPRGYAGHDRCADTFELMYLDI